MYPKDPLKGLFGPEMAFPAPDQRDSSFEMEEYTLLTKLKDNIQGFSVAGCETDEVLGRAMARALSGVGGR